MPGYVGCLVTTIPPTPPSKALEGNTNWAAIDTSLDSKSQQRGEKKPQMCKGGMMLPVGRRANTAQQRVSKQESPSVVFTGAGANNVAFAVAR